MRKAKRLLKHIKKCMTNSSFLFLVRIIFGESWLNQFKIFVTIIVPNKFINSLCCKVKTITFKSISD